MFVEVDDSLNIFLGWRTVLIVCSNEGRFEKFARLEHEVGMVCTDGGCFRRHDHVGHKL